MSLFYFGCLKIIIVDASFKKSQPQSFNVRFNINHAKAFIFSSVHFHFSSNILLKLSFNFPFINVPIMCLRVFLVHVRKILVEQGILIGKACRFLLKLFCQEVLSTAYSKDWFDWQFWVQFHHGLNKVFISDKVLTWKPKMVACVTGVYPISFIICCDKAGQFKAKTVVFSVFVSNPDSF